MSWCAVLGQKVNNFQIVRLLGEGGMGSVYEADHLIIQRRVAVKVLRREHALDGVLVQRFFNEARATSAIRHPNIVEVIDLGQFADGVPYIVMELLEGESLGSRLTRVGCLSVEAAIDIVCQTASALEAAHDNGIVHRDLKPDNLFLTPDPRFADRELVKVLDFGIAKLRVDHTTAPVHTLVGTVLGTPAYMSPEQCRGVEVDHRTDIYSLGIILYELLCGEPPFAGEAVGDILLMHMSRDPPAPRHRRSNLPEYVERTILRALAKRPEDRFPSAAEFADGLDYPSSGAFAQRPSTPPASQSGVHAGFGNNHDLHASRQSGKLEPLRPTLLSNSADAQTDHRTKVSEPRNEIREASQTPTPTPRWNADTSTGRDDAMAAPQRSLRQYRGLAVVALVGLAVAIAVGTKLLGKVTSSNGSSAHSAIAQAQNSAPASPALAATGSEVIGAVRAADLLRAVQQSSTAATPGRALPVKSVRQTMPTATPVAIDPPSTAVTASRPSPIPEGPTRAAEPGYLSLDSAPWSEVFLAGKLLGSTPLLRVPLPPGRHALTLKNPELGTSTSYVVEIVGGRSVSRFVGWGKE